jgi:hypothetical protein
MNSATGIPPNHGIGGGCSTIPHNVVILSVHCRDYTTLTPPASIFSAYKNNAALFGGVTSTRCRRYLLGAARSIFMNRSKRSWLKWLLVVSTHRPRVTAADPPTCVSLTNSSPARVNTPIGDPSNCASTAVSRAHAVLYRLCNACGSINIQ